VSSGREGRQCLERRRYLGLYGEVHLQAVETKLGGDGPRPTVTLSRRPASTGA
jgi:hypothetical protein